MKVKIAHFRIKDFSLITNEVIKKNKIYNAEKLDSSHFSITIGNNNHLIKAWWLRTPEGLQIAENPAISRTEFVKI